MLHDFKRHEEFRENKVTLHYLEQNMQIINLAEWVIKLVLFLFWCNDFNNINLIYFLLLPELTVIKWI